MSLTVRIEGLYNHETGMDYKKGLQEVDDEALNKLAFKKVKDDYGVIMVLASKGHEFPKAKAIQSDDAEADTGNPPDDSNDNVDLALRNGLDLNDKLSANIHKLLNDDKMSYSAITRAMGGDSNKQAEVTKWKEKSLPIVDKLIEGKVICKKGKTWGYVGAEGV